MFLKKKKETSSERGSGHHLWHNHFFFLARHLCWEAGENEPGKLDCGRPPLWHYPDLVAYGR
jgi:hypothetical protein